MSCYPHAVQLNEVQSNEAQPIDRQLLMNSTDSSQKAGHVTYSPAHTIVPTYECFNRCSYCNFRADPGHDTWMTLAQAEAILQPLRAQGIIEVLILSGEVHERSSRRQAWFQHVYDLCQLALNLGFLPHTNAGILTFEEMARLKTVNVSMGLMLEQMTPELLNTVHRHAPSKMPALRLQQLEWAGQLNIPFTTGLLLGIGETEQDWVETLTAIAQVQQRYGHIQEVILQPHSPGQSQSWQGEPFPAAKLLRAVTIARQLLPPSVTIQIPPNLISEPTDLIACLEAGARDLGGIGIKDEVNPDYPHPYDAALAATLKQRGWQLHPRLPIYSQYDEWLAPPLRSIVQQYRVALAALVADQSKIYFL